MKVVFLLANKNLNQISTEAATYDDILAGDFLDSFHNLTFKDSMLMTWAKEKCPSKFIFKGDDDILLNPYGQGLNMNNNYENKIFIKKYQTLLELKNLLLTPISQWPKCLAHFYKDELFQEKKIRNMLISNGTMKLTQIMSQEEVF